ncbi:MAG: hypothetical protein IKK10_00365 [Clostridia bacterium]|nr:hypothetical protein [Clostridia bacterium]
MNTGFSTVDLSKEDEKTFLKNMSVSVLEEEQQEWAIDCFDVAENGDIAIGCSNINDKKVYIYSSEGEYKRGYSFDCMGSYGVEFEDDILLVYFVRSDIAMALDPVGNIVELAEIENTIENNSYWNNTVNAKKRIVADKEYKVKNNLGILNIFASSYSQLVVTDQTGAEKVIYDVSALKLRQVIGNCSIFVVISCCVLCGIVWQFKKNIKNDAN